MSIKYLDQPYTYVLDQPITPLPVFPPKQKIFITSKEEAYMFFENIYYNPEHFKIYVVDEDKMLINMIVNLQQAMDFYKGD